MFAVERFDLLGTDSFEHNGMVTGLADLMEKGTGISVRVVVLHGFHPRNAKSHAGHLEGILKFARGRNVGDNMHCTVLAGDFNEDPRQSLQPAAQALVRDFVTASREDHPELPIKSTTNPNIEHKLDWVWVEGAQVEYDDRCKRAIISSHTACPETGQWPSDHGLEAVRLLLSRRALDRFVAVKGQRGVHTKRKAQNDPCAHAGLRHEKS